MSDPSLIRDPAILEAAARALEPWNPCYYQVMAKAALAAVTPLIRAQVLEEAAKVAKGYYLFRTEDTEDVAAICDAIAAAIRALKEQP